MNSANTQSVPDAMLERLVAATNAHDLEGLVDCFQPDYVNETPAHPERGFVGRDQVRVNWKQIFAGVPDLQVRVSRCAIAGESVWAEMEMIGTRRDGSRHLMRGIVIFGVVDGRAAWARFYLEPVQDGSADINAVVAAQVGPRP